MTHTHIKVLTATGLFSISTLLHAEDDLFFEMPIVLSASRLEQPVSETAVSVTSIDREMIEASGARNIPDILRLVPGMQVGYASSEFGDEPKYVVTYHGHSDQFSKRMQVLIDGRSIYEPLLGGVDWASLPINIDDIERIEVTRGPNAPIYGSNSFLGVVNIITRHAAEDKGHLFGINAGNHDIFDTIYRFGDSTENMDYRVTVATHNDDGADRANDLATYDDNNTKAIDYRFDFQLNTTNQLTYQGGYRDNVTQAPANIRDGYRVDRDVDNILAHQYLKWEKNLGSDESMVIQYYFNIHDKIDVSDTSVIDIPPFDPFTIEFDGSLTSKRHNLEFIHIFEPTTELKVLWGLSQQHDEAQSIFWLNTNDYVKRDTSRAFTNVEWKLSETNTLNFGVLLEKNETTGSSSSPRVALIHHLNSKHNLRFGVSQSVRIPFLVEDYANTQFTHDTTIAGTPTGLTLLDQQLLGSEQLVPEKITSREIAYHGRIFNDDLLISSRLFYDNLSNLIDVPLIPVDVTIDNVNGVAQQFTNANRSIVKGIETEFDYYYDETFRVISNFALLKADSDEPVIDGTTREIIESVPEKNFSVLLINKFNSSYSASMGFYYVSDFAWLDANPNTVPTLGVRNTRGYRKLDLRLSRTFRSGQEKIKTSLILQNLAGDYSDYDAHPAPGSEPVIQDFTTYLEAKFQFK